MTGRERPALIGQRQTHPERTTCRVTPVSSDCRQIWALARAVMPRGPRPSGGCLQATSPRAHRIGGGCFPVSTRLCRLQCRDASRLPPRPAALRRCPRSPPAAAAEPRRGPGRGCRTKTERSPGAVGVRSTSYGGDAAGTHNGLRSHGHGRCLVIGRTPVVRPAR